jgi:hypothetical protein
LRASRRTATSETEPAAILRDGASRLLRMRSVGLSSIRPIRLVSWNRSTRPAYHHPCRNQGRWSVLRVKGRSYAKGAPACAFQSFRAEDPREVGVRTRNDVARGIGILDGSLPVGERAPPRTKLFRRHADVAGALGAFVWGLGVADHLVLLPIGGGRGLRRLT